MKETFFPQNFFDLSLTNFPQLFSTQEPAWEVLKKIKPFLDNFHFLKNSQILSVAVHLINPEQIFWGEGCKVSAYATIEGPCYIGPYVEIGPHAYIRAYSILERGAKVGHCSEVKHSILLAEAKLPHFNYVGDSVVGSFVNLGAGAVCANFKTNKKEVWIKHEGVLYETGLKKFGAIIGDESFIGCHCVTNPGAILKKGFKSSPCTSLKGVFI